MSAARHLSAAALCLALAACSAPPAGPGLLTRDQIAAARDGGGPPPDTADLQARAARLAARAAQLRRTTIDSHEQQLLRQRSLALAAR